MVGLGRPGNPLHIHFQPPPPALVSPVSTSLGFNRECGSRRLAHEGFADHLVNISGGKDSTATYLLALESGIPFRAAMADTGHEHEWTMQYVADLPKVTGGPEVEIVRADFAQDIARKRALVARKWPADLIAGKPGGWVWKGGEESGGRPPPPSDVYAPAPSVGDWIWKPGHPPISADEAAERVARRS